MIGTDGTDTGPVLVGVDVGGTFTDAVALVPGRSVTLAKVPTTPDDQSRGVLEAVDAVLERAGLRHRDVARFAHGMTVGTNALLEGRGADTALVVTQGFGDLLELRRQDRAHLYRLSAAHPPPLVPRERVVEAAERCDAAGVRVPLTDAAVADVVRRVRDMGVATVAVCLLHAYRHAAHERRLADALRAALPGVHVSTSHEVLPAVREYERAATTVVDAYLNPLMRRYLGALGARLGDAGLPTLEVMQSSGGLTDAATAAAHASRTVLSGPAGGVVGAARLAGGEAPRAITFDMGGTSCDVALVEDGAPGRTQRSEIAGRPLHLPMLDIVTVSAGGGSIAWADSGGALRVGPESAGAVPGPAAYGRGGARPTVTDANVVLGRLDAGTPLAGGVRLDADAARRAVAGLAQALGITVEACAEGIVRVANHEMARAVRRVSVERGVDPRQATLVAFGGAGPLHGCDVAAIVGARTVWAPAAAGAMAALGLVLAGRRRDRMASVDRLVADGDEVSRTARELAAGLADGMREPVLTFRAACRYEGQRHELVVDWDPAGGDAALAAAFHRAHARQHGDERPGSPVRALSVEASAEEPGPAAPVSPDAGTDRLTGPVAVAGDGSTFWLPEGWTAARRASGDIVATAEAT